MGAHVCMCKRGIPCSECRERVGGPVRRLWVVWVIETTYMRVVGGGGQIGAVLGWTNGGLDTGLRLKEVSRINQSSWLCSQVSGPGEELMKSLQVMLLHHALRNMSPASWDEDLLPSKQVSVLRSDTGAL